MSFQITSSLQDNPYSTYLKYLFEQTSYTPFPDTIKVPNEAWFDYIDTLYQAWNYNVPNKVVTNSIPVTNIVPSKEAIIGFSAGKDSASVALALKDLNIKTTLYNVQGLNRSYGHEHSVAQSFADKIGFPIVVNKLSYKGKATATDPVVKNHLILAYMIGYMIEHNIGYCSLGEYPNLNLKDYALAYNTSDAYDLILKFEKAVQATFPQFKFFVLFNSQTHAYAYLVDKHYVYLDYTQSCLLPDRFRARVKAANEKKYNIQLNDNRCLACYKCCHEALFLHMWKTKVLPKEAITKSLGIMRRDLDKMLDLPSSVIQVLSTEELINKYIDVNEVIMYQKDKSLISSTLRLDGIKELL